MHTGSAWQEKPVLHYCLSNEVRSMSYLLKDVQQRAYDAVIAKYNEGVIT